MRGREYHREAGTLGADGSTFGCDFGSYWEIDKWLFELGLQWSGGGSGLLWSGIWLIVRC